LKLIFTISFVILASCGLIEIDLPKGEEQIVIEGWITDQNKQHWVKVSKTVAFDNSRKERPVQNATVTIEDNTGIFTLSHDDDGIYLTDSLAGIEARSYRLRIELESGEIIQSEWERLNPLQPIETIRYDFFRERDPETGENMRIYFPIVVSSDPVEENNFYRYKGFRNGELLNEPNELILLSDQFVNGANSLRNFIPEFRYAFNDTIRVELHSLTKTGFEFLELLKSQTTSLGSSSGTSPATLSGNLRYLEDESKIVLGFFGASSVSSGTTIIDQ